MIGNQKQNSLDDLAMEKDKTNSRKWAMQMNTNKTKRRKT